MTFNHIQCDFHFFLSFVFAPGFGALVLCLYDRRGRLEA